MRFTLLFCLLISFNALAQQGPRKVVLVTLDGLRWHELFQGANPDRLRDTKVTKDVAVVEQFGAADAEARREKLMPFMWNTVAEKGQLYGDRKQGSKVNCSNTYLFSYPGYSELLVGFADRRVKSNKKVENPNRTVLEFIASDPAYQDKVAVFSTWESIPYAAGALRGGLPFASKYETTLGEQNGESKRPRAHEPEVIAKHSDRVTFERAFAYLQEYRPHVLFIGFDETDANGHRGKYDKYLSAAHDTDSLLSLLWEWIQHDQEYRNNTTLIVTTDHGRGHLFRNSWRNHGILSPGSRHIWMAVMGPDTPATGVVADGKKYYQKQVAQTMAALVNLEYSNTRPVGAVMQGVLHAGILTRK
jgi:hypothetical protein